MTKRVAECSCGQLKIACEGGPVRISMCHCLACQRRTGSAFGIQARFPRERVSVEGRAAQYERIGDEGGRVTFHFCPVCGATAYYEASFMDGFIAVPVGAFADPNFPPPTIAVYEARRHRWAVMPELQVEHID
jgi:hypothetical protein